MGIISSHTEEKVGAAEDFDVPLAPSHATEQCAPAPEGYKNFTLCDPASVLCAAEVGLQFPLLLEDQVNGSDKCHRPPRENILHHRPYTLWHSD